MLPLTTALASALLVLGVAVASPEAAVYADRLDTAGPAHHRTSEARSVLQGMTLPQRVGQLFTVGTQADRADPRTRSQIRRYHVGSVMLTGRSHGGTRPPAAVSRTMRSQVSEESTHGVRLFVGTDQEGGNVRVLQGRGISDIPAALVQGGWAPHRLRDAAQRWAGELRRSGVNLNLAPVMDTVPGARAAESNPPIGVFDRELGYDPATVARHGVAFLRGMADRHVVPTVKHFPGLGRVHANPDTASGVTDRVTRRHDPYLRPFQAAVDAGVPVVMMSTAYYPRMDRRHPAAFSRFVIGTVLRGDLGFRGVVMSDDLGHARQVAQWSPGGRALRFVRAGGDLVLTVDPATLPRMYDAVLDRARRVPAFRAVVDRAALRVLRAKERQHLLGS